MNTAAMRICESFCADVKFSFLGDRRPGVQQRAVWQAHVQFDKTAKCFSGEDRSSS